MTEEEMKIVIEKLRTEKAKNDAIFGLFIYGGGPEESFIKANKSGLEIFAAKLLEASLENDSVINHKEKSIIHLEEEAEWIDKESDIYLDYIEPISRTRPQKLPEKANKTSKFKDELFQVGCVLILVFLGVAVLLGIGKMWALIFN